MNRDCASERNGSDLLKQLELILDSDPLIDEVGFVHPSQFATLDKEAGGFLTSSDSHEDANFWNREHKLAISTHVLLLLYRAAKQAFTDAIRQYKELGNSSATSGERYVAERFDILETEVMRHSKALLLLSSDFGTAWNSRKLILSKKQHTSVFIDELLLSNLVLSYSHKSEQTWCHRRWVIKMIAGKCSTFQEIVLKESELVEEMAQKSKMNYRAWNHRCWLVSWMTREQVLHELKKTRDWSSLHVADNCCFHYRTLLLRILEQYSKNQEYKSPGLNSEIYQIWQGELDWNEVLIKRYVGREALWLHRRFLSLCWISNFTTNLLDVRHHSEHKSRTATDITIFLDNELHLVNSCSVIPDNQFKDFEAQATHSAAYILWLAMQIPKSHGIELWQKLRSSRLKTVLMAYSERSFLYDTLSVHFEGLQTLT